VLDGLTRLAGAGSMRVAIARRNHAAALRASGDLGTAARALDGAAHVLAALPEDDPERIDTLKVEAFLLCVRDQPQDALAVAERAIALGIRRWDVDHPFVAAAELTAATAERLLRRYRSARRRLTGVIACFERAYGAHPLTAIALHRMARVELDDDNHDDAEAYARRAFAMYRSFYPRSLLATGSTLIDILMQRGELREARELAAEVELGVPEADRFRVPLLLAQAQTGRYQIADALEDLRRARTLAPAEYHADLDLEIAVTLARHDG
jgi:tetratricopeptide (TPR) repeat protein